VWIFQDGNLSGLLGFESTGALHVVVPVIVCIFAFGLSMDYQVFLLSRIKEAHDGLPGGRRLRCGASLTDSGCTRRTTTSSRPDRSPRRA